MTWSLNTDKDKRLRIASSVVSVIWEGLHFYHQEDREGSFEISGRDIKDEVDEIIDEIAERVVEKLVARGLTR
jgi:hypothetical protein